MTPPEYIVQSMPRTDADETPWSGGTNSAPALGESATRLARDAVVHAGGYIASTVVSFALIPFLVRGLAAADYGIWLVSLSASAALGTLTIALWWTVNREVAGVDDASAAGTLVADAVSTTFVVGCVGGVFLWIAGARGWVGNPSSDEHRTVLSLAGPTFFCEQIAACGSAVLAGRRRFLPMNAIIVASNVMRAASILFVVAGGEGRVLVVALCHVAFAGLSALALLVALFAGTPWLRSIRPVFPYSVLRTSLPFSARLQLTVVVSTATLQLVPLIVARMFGPAAVVPIYVGQRIPQFASIIAHRVGEAAYPLLVQITSRGGIDAVRQAVIRATKWTFALGVPGFAAMVFGAPLILRLWLGTYPLEAVVLCQLAAVAYMFDTVALPLDYALLAAGRTGIVLLVATCSAVVNVGVLVWLLPSLGVRAAGIALLASCVTGALAYVMATQRLGIPRRAWRST